jgi:hypothetical protein
MYTIAPLQDLKIVKASEAENVCYDYSTRHQETPTIHNGASDNAPIIPQPRPAVGFDRSILARLTPTLENLTLQGKVAMVAG